VEYIEKFPYVIKRKHGKTIIVVDALSRRYILLINLETIVLGFDHIKEFYQNDYNFSQIFMNVLKDHA